MISSSIFHIFLARLIYSQIKLFFNLYITDNILIESMCSKENFHPLDSTKKVKIL